MEHRKNTNIMWAYIDRTFHTAIETPPPLILQVSRRHEVSYGGMFNIKGGGLHKFVERALRFQLGVRESCRHMSRHDEKLLTPLASVSIEIIYGESVQIEG